MNDRKMHLRQEVTVVELLTPSADEGILLLYKRIKIY